MISVVDQPAKVLEKAERFEQMRLIGLLQSCQKLRAFLGLVSAIY